MLKIKSLGIFGLAALHLGIGPAQATEMSAETTFSVQCDRDRHEEVRWDSDAGGYRFDSKKDCPAIRPEAIDREAWVKWSERVRTNSDKLGNSPIDIQMIVNDFNVAADSAWTDFAECFEGKSNPENAARDAYTTGKGIPRGCQKQYQAVRAFKERWREFLNTSSSTSVEWAQAMERWRDELKTAPSYHPLLVQTMIEFATTHRVYYKLDQGKSPSENKNNQSGALLGFALAAGAMFSLDGVVVGSSKEKQITPMINLGIIAAVLFGNKVNDHKPRYDSKKYSINLYLNSVALLANRSTSSCKDFGFWPMAAGGVLYGIEQSNGTMANNTSSAFENVNKEVRSLTYDWSAACDPKTTSSGSQYMHSTFGWNLWRAIVKSFRSLGER